MKIGGVLAHLRELEQAYADELRDAAERHRAEADVHHQCRTFADAAERRSARLASLADAVGGSPSWGSPLPGSGKELLEDLRALCLAARAVQITWIAVGQAAKVLRSVELQELAKDCIEATDMEARWFLTRIKTGAPQELVVA
jgi:hypothetical protein